MTLKLGMIRGVFSITAARIVTNLLSAGAIMVFARILSPEDFGIIAIASSVLSVVQSCTELSLSGALILKRDVQKSHVDTVWTMALLRSLALCALFGLLAWPLSLVYSSPALVPVFLVSGFTGAVMGLQNPMISLATKQLRFGPYAIVEISQKFFSIAVGIALAFYLQSYWAIIAGNALGALGCCVLSYLLLDYRPGFSLRHVSEIWAFSSWLFFKQMCETLNWRIDQILIGLFAPTGQLGVYAMADNLAQIPSRETMHPVKQALFPGLANLNDDPERLRRVHIRAQATIAMVTVPLAMGLALVAEPAVKIILGAQWIAAVPFVQISAIFYSIGAFSIGFQPTALAIGKTKSLFVMQAIVLVLRTPLILAGILLYGLIGVAIGRLLSEVISVALQLLASRSLIGPAVWSQIKSHGFTLFGLVTMAGSVLLVGSLDSSLHLHDLGDLVVKVAFGGAAYVAAIGLAWLLAGRPESSVSEILAILYRLVSTLQDGSGLKLA